MGASSDLKQSFKDTLNSLNIMTKILHATTTPHTPWMLHATTTTYFHGCYMLQQPHIHPWMLHATTTPHTSMDVSVCVIY